MRLQGQMVGVAEVGKVPANCVLVQPFKHYVMSLCTGWLCRHCCTMPCVAACSHALAGTLQHTQKVLQACNP